MPTDRLTFVEALPVWFQHEEHEDALLRSPGGQLLDVGVPSGFAVGAFGWMLVEKS